MRQDLIKEVTTFLHEAFGPDATFRDGQLEAILNVISNRRQLIVQRTGWGKSLVYFLATKYLRKHESGPTLIISPLLSLMRNQQEASELFGLNVRSINSSNEENHETILFELEHDTIDMLMIAPEQIANEERFSNIQSRIKSVGLFVVDEAHCISDWGHDFRPDYRRIVDFVRNLPKNVPVLATTATANSRVVNDVSSQLGDLEVIRGPLARESLKIKVISLPGFGDRLIWLRNNLNRFEGSGIVYCLTKKTTLKVTEYLRSVGIDAYAYNADLDADSRRDLEYRFNRNELKCLVATIALGMGYDKPDISFVVHFQRPANLISYYQQIGRAGRKLENAYVILLSGNEDDEILEYFINNAFPTENEIDSVLGYIGKSQGVKLSDLKRRINASESRIKNCIKYLEVEKLIFKNRIDRKYYRTANIWNADNERSEKITKRRHEEFKEMKEFLSLKSCYMEYISLALDDPYYHECGKCNNCEPFHTVDIINKEELNQVIDFVESQNMIIEPRKQFPFSYHQQFKLNEEMQYEPGRILCEYNGPILGWMIAEDKYKTGYVRDELISASLDLLRSWNELPKEDLCVCYVPSATGSVLVKTFAEKIANKLNVKCHTIITKSQNAKKQKSLQNSVLQFENAMEAYEVISTEGLTNNILLIDDIVDSRWTLAAITYKLKLKKSCKVYPFTIADSSGKVIHDKLQ